RSLGRLCAGPLADRRGVGDAGVVHRRGVLPARGGAVGGVGAGRLQPADLAGIGRARSDPPGAVAVGPAHAEVLDRLAAGPGAGVELFRQTEARVRRRPLKGRHTSTMAASADAITFPARLGDLLLAREAIRPADLERALELQAVMGGRLGHLLVRIGALSEDQLLEVLSAQLGVPVLGREAAIPLDPADWGVPGNADLSVD